MYLEKTPVWKDICYVMFALVTQLCPTLCNPTNCSLPGSSVHGILQARVLKWVAIPFSRGSSNPGIEPWSPALQADFLPFELRGSPKRGMHWLHWARNWIQAPAWQAGSYHWTTHAPCNVCTTLFTVARQKQHECPSTEGWIQKMRCICPVEYCSAIKKDELMPFAVTYFYRVDYICQDKDF